MIDRRLVLAGLAVSPALARTSVKYSPVATTPYGRVCGTIERDVRPGVSSKFIIPCSSESIGTADPGVGRISDGSHYARLLATYRV